MTSDELRQKCIEAMQAAFFEAYSSRIDSYVVAGIAKGMPAAFGALHGLVRVVPVYATEMMQYSCDESEDIRICFDKMAAAGDLTRPRK